MMLPIPLSCAVILLAVAAAVWRVPDVRRARRLATLGAALAAIVALVWVGLRAGGGATATGGQRTPGGLLDMAPFVTCMVALIAVILAPAASHPPRTLSRVLQLCGVALLFLASDSAPIMAGTWALSAAIAASELTAGGRSGPATRLFAVYHLASVVLFAAGSVWFVSSGQFLGMAAVILAIVLREAVVPAHGWFPRFAEQAPMGIVVAFAAPQLGVFAHIQLLSATIPPTAAPYLAAVGAVTAVVAAGLGLVQTNAKRAFAYLVISQTGLVSFGLENASPVAIAGAMLTWTVLALAISGFGMSMAALEARRGALSLHAPGGSFAATPRLAIAFLVLGFSTVGLPATLGFVAEDLLVQGSVAEFPLLCLGLILATALNGMTVMRCFFVLFSGRATRDGERDLVPRESLGLTIVLAMLILGGVFPGAIVTLQSRGSEAGARPATHDHKAGDSRARTDVRRIR